jgi:hypothetical protein
VKHGRHGSGKENMTKNEFKILYQFNDQQMDFLDRFRAFFNCKKPCVVIDQKQWRWVQDFVEKGGPKDDIRRKNKE